MLDDHLGIVRAFRESRGEGGEDVHRLVLGQAGVCVRLRGCEVRATTGNRRCVAGRRGRVDKAGRGGHRTVTAGSSIVQGVQSMDGNAAGVSEG